MGKFDLAAAMKLDVSKLDTDTQIEQIALDLIDPNPENFFEVEDDITDLAESISLNGLQQPIVVTPAGNGRYRVIAGHRRRKALIHLAESDPEKWRTAPCIVQRPTSPEMEMLMLIQTNTESRELGWHEKSTAADKVEKILVKLQQEQGITLPGKMRERVAKIIKTSESQLARAKYIKEHLIPAAKKMGLSDNVSYKMAHLPKEDQQALCEHYKDRKWSLDGPAIKKYQDNVKAGRDPFAKDNGRKGCYYSTNVTCTMSCPVNSGRDCCYSCHERFNCESVCAPTEERNNAVKQSEAYAIGQRLKSIVERNNLNPDQICQAFNYSSHSINLIYAGQFNSSYLNFSNFCKRYKISADELLGLKPAAPSSVSEESGWRRLYTDGHPEKGQYCAVLVTDNISTYDQQKLCDIWTALWTGYEFVSAINGKTETRRTILGWKPLPDPPEGYSYCVGKKEKSE